MAFGATGCKSVSVWSRARFLESAFPHALPGDLVIWMVSIPLEQQDGQEGRKGCSDKWLEFCRGYFFKPSTFVLYPRGEVDCHAMSIALAIAYYDDCIVTTDCRLCEDDLSLICDDMQKSARLSDTCLIALTGHTDDIRQVLIAMGFSLDGVVDKDIYLAVEKQALNSPLGYLEAERRILGFLPSDGDDAGKQHRCSVSLVGKRGRRNAITIWTQERGVKSESAFSDPVPAAIGKLPPDGSRECNAFWRTLNPRGDRSGIEGRMRSSISCAAKCDSDNTIGPTIQIRHMCEDWRLGLTTC